MLTYLMVYRRGGDYDPLYVERLARALARQSHPGRIVCLTDESPDNMAGFGVEVRKLDNDWPGWWSKIEAFRVPGPVVYFDLDTVIVGDVGQLAEWAEKDGEGFAMLRGFYKSDLCSGVMAWRGNARWILRRFVNDLSSDARFIPGPHGSSLRCRSGQYRGDQDWIRHLLCKRAPTVPVIAAQDIMDGILSYKVHLEGKEYPPESARIIVFHGYPRPHEVENVPWIAEHMQAVGQNK